MRWPGFRKVRHQVCQRVKHRIDARGLNGFASYRRRLETDPRKWRILDQYNDFPVFPRSRRIRNLPQHTSSHRREEVDDARFVLRPPKSPKFTKVS
jgi:hypothetical protein